MAELPREVAWYLDALHLNLAPKALPERKPMPGFREPVYILPVVDEGTGETVRIVMGHPTAEYERYRLVRLTNKLGYTVTALAPREEAEKLIVKPPPVKEAETAVKEAERIVEVEPYRTPLADWRYLSELASRLQSWVESGEKWAEAREVGSVLMYVRDISEYSKAGKTHLVGAAEEVLKPYEEKAVSAKVLTDEEYARLWREFSEALAKAGLDPTAYRSRFEALVAWNMPYEDNLNIVLDEARSIVAEETLLRKTYVAKRIVEPPVRFSWKYVSWGLASMKLDVADLKEAVKHRDALRAYMDLSRIAETAQRLEKLLAMKL